ncbi:MULTISPECIES: site-specific integrase [unclassified Brevundimonas]|uniref:site-specific integrase n=1 Tax=unclassified Brevundimonas TaxID=2622653 RepID=UPI0025B84701|nr:MULTISPECIES: site-specific integrase [unclassified Brevundimonas]
MARVPAHLIIRNGVYNYRRRVPADLRSNPVFKGRDVFQASLGVRTLKEARRVVQELRLDELFERRFAPVADVEGGTVLTPSLLTHLAREQYERGLESLHRERMEETNEHREWLDELAAQELGALNDPVWSSDARARLRRDADPYLQSRAEIAAKKLGIDHDAVAVRKIADALFEAEVSLTGARVELASGRTLTTTPAYASSPSGTSNAPTQREAHWTFKRLAEATMRQHPKGESWEHKVKVVAALFDEYVGSAPIYKIDRRMVRNFVNDLHHMPDRMTMRFPKMTLKEAIAANETREKPYGTISPNTVRDGYFSILRWAFGHAVELEAIPLNPCTATKIRGATKGDGRRTRNPFKVNELNAFFRLPMFTGCLSEDRPNTPGDYTFDNHRRWAPLVMLFTGARPSEIAQLAVSDIKGDAKHPYISILTEYDPNDPDDERDFVVSHKTENARRDIPLHPELISLGFLRYVADRQRSGDVRLFPEWKLPAAGRKLYSSASWIRNTNERLIPKITNRHPRPTLYSFRHTWKTQMALHQVPTQYQNQILGHAQQGMDDHYLGRMDIEHTYAAIKNISFTGLDLDHLKSY